MCRDRLTPASPTGGLPGASVRPATALIITEEQRAKMWFHAVLHATMIYNLKITGGTNEAGMKRLEAGIGKKTSLSSSSPFRDALHRQATAQRWPR